MTGQGFGPGTPLAGLEVVVLASETTGLDIRADRVIQIVALRAGPTGIDAGGAFARIVDPGIPIPEAATRIHGLNDAHVVGKPAFAAIAGDLAAFIGEAVVLGHAIRFHAAILRFEAARHGIAWREPQLLDIGLLTAGIAPEMVDTSLDTLAATLGLSTEGRHTARGDALIAARIWRAMLPRLRDHGIHTLGEAMTVAQRPAELIARQERAGWFERTSATPDFSQIGMRQGARKAIDGFLYRHSLRDVMASPPIDIARSATLGEAARLMTERGIGCLIVSEPGRRPGILTERDVLRAFGRLGAAAGDCSVTEVMSAPVITAPADTLLYRALGRMARSNLRYLGVTDGARGLVGVFTLRTLLRQRALVALSIGDEIASARNAEALARAWSALPGLVGALLASGLAAPQVAGVISAETCAMTARAAELAEAEMDAEGLGRAPAPFALLTLGSAGRGESLLAADQDNALVVADAYAGSLGAPDDWFTAFGARVNAILDTSGIPLCRAGVMAGNRAWRRRLGEWRARFAEWERDPRPGTILNADIFHDFVCVHASCQEGAALARSLAEAARTSSREAPGFLRALGDAALAMRPPLGLFGRLQRDNQGRADLKTGGLLPIAAGARVMALRHGIEARATPARLAATAEIAGRGGSDADRVAEAHGVILGLVLSQQVADVAAGIRPTSRIDLTCLDRAATDRLRDALGRVETLGLMLRDLLDGL